MLPVKGQCSMCPAACLSARAVDCPAAGLSQTLNEFRQTTLQLQKLQSHEVRRLQAVEQQGTGGGGVAGGASSVAAAVAAVEAASVAGGAAHGGGAASASDGGSPKPASAGGAATPTHRAGRSLSNSPKAAAAMAPAPAPAPSPQAVEASRIAEQLEDVSGGANSGLLASAAVALRELSRRDAELVAAQQVRRWAGRGLGRVQWGHGGRSCLLASLPACVHRQLGAHVALCPALGLLCCR